MEKLSTVQTAKLIKKELKKLFPEQKFSIRSEVYSGGSSINIFWRNGVSKVKVEEVVRKYENAYFDSMTDTKYYLDKPYLVDYVFCNREIDQEIYDEEARKWGYENFEKIDDYHIASMIAKELDKKDL